MRLIADKNINSFILYQPNHQKNCFQYYKGCILHSVSILASLHSEVNFWAKIVLYFRINICTINLLCIFVHFVETRLTSWCPLPWTAGLASTSQLLYS